jgi:hypothetical protein
MILAFFILILFMLEVMVDVRKKHLAGLKTPVGIAKICMIPFLLLQICDHVIFMYGMLHTHDPIDEEVEYGIDAAANLIIFGVITALAIGWYGLLLRSKRLERSFPLKKTRIAMIVLYVAFAITLITLVIIEGLDHAESLIEMVDAGFILIFSVLISWHLVKLTQWISKKKEDKADKSNRIDKIAQRNKFLIAVVVILLLDAVKNLIVVWLPEQRFASTHLLVLELNEWFYLFISIALFLFAQNYFLVIGVMRGYIYVDEIPSTHSGSGTSPYGTSSTLKTGTGNSSTLKNKSGGVSGGAITSVASVYSHGHSSGSSTTSVDDVVMTTVASEEKIKMDEEIRTSPTKEKKHRSEKSKH